MKRRDFLISSCTACLSASAMAGLLSGCKSTQYVTGHLNKDGLLVDKDDFKINNNDYRSYIVVRHDELKFPVCIYRFSDTEYSAIWMQCAHQGAELQVAGAYLQCPAHGSEYSNKGKVTNGPAERDLRTFPVTVNHSQLFIDLRKQ
ncbi:Rieske (2Fe-2S) protein [Paraflavitalea sp. CAU 1676]|uniref:Rieske (2Fe-2S) protein n=1 Tax=Paraflavitalea sp. CAU 1676 TaxID=3032598 RepID=UPI0023DB0FAA|nr:Rieske (2Fe-2S) protein [Paraflavitalea sp. CAU 1676]MDF2191351.1 Rieske (2Fe-2S) protein [Paraflavitalea sp. CAU 1676]